MNTFRRFFAPWVPVCIALSLALAPPATAEEHPNLPVGDRGSLPVGENGQPLNLDFEDGSLKDWTATGAAFAEQPIKGEIDQNRTFGEGKKSEHTGEYWIGGYERLQDEPTGELQSKPFIVTHLYATFLIGGGSHDDTRVELVRADTGEVFFKVSGKNEENLRPVVVDLRSLAGKSIYVRLVDHNATGWGHVNFDDFRLHEQAPKFPFPELVVRPAPPIEQLYPHAGLPADKAAAVMQLPPGFSVQVGAAEPDVRQPIAMTIDDRGRIWVAEAYEYPHRAKDGEGRDRILIFEDTDLNGSLDSRKVFVEGLNLVSGLEVGFGGVWVGAAPYLLFIPDRDGDDKPDGDPETLLDGWGYQDTHETLNSFIWGPDGWLYGCHGVFTHSRVGKPGAPDDERQPINAGIWRYHPTRHQFEVFAHGTSNPWGVDFNDHGQCFLTACVIPHLFHVIQGARYHRQGGQHFNPHTYDDIKTIAEHRHYVGNQWNNDDRRRSDDLGGGHAHAGAMIYLGGAWPAAYRDQIFMSNIHGNRINQDQLAPRGSGYVGTAAPDFLRSLDQWSQMLYLRSGPDGQVWVIDWYDGNQCHRLEEEVHDRTNGRIYRLVYDGASPVAVNLASASDAELVELQQSPNDWMVRTARRILQERAAAGRLGQEVRPALQSLALSHADATRRLRGLWALHATGGVPAELLERLLKDENPYVRSWTIQLSCEDNAAPPSRALLDRFAAMAAHDPSQIVRLYLASALQRLPLADRWAILDGLAEHAEDAGDHNLPLLTWYAAEPLAADDMERALAWSLRAGKHNPMLAQYMIRRIGAEGNERALELLVHGLSEATDASIQTAYLTGIRDALRGMRQVSPPKSWPTAYAALQKLNDADIAWQALGLAVTFGDSQAREKMRSVVADEQAAVDRRKEAIASLVKARDADVVDVLVSLVTHGDLGGDAIRGLAAFEDARTPAALVEAYDKLSAEARRDAVATLCARAGYAKELLKAIEQKQIPSKDVTAEMVRQLRNLKDEQLDQRIVEVWGIVRDTAADKAELMEKYTALAKAEGASPDVALGRAVFAKACQQCHTLYATGGNVGPDLTGSNRANLEYLLSNVLDPSAVMAKEYQPTVVQTDDGRVITGILKAEDAASITLQTQNETIVVPRGEIEDSRRSEKSMMPDDLLKQFGDHEVRSLIAYLATTRQVPLLANSENAASFFNGNDLTGWRGDTALWSVENGEIVGVSPGLEHNQFLISELAVEDFTLTFDVKLDPNEGNSGVQFRSVPIAGGEMKGYQADIGAGWWGKLYEENGRALLWDKSGEKHVRPGEWNSYEITASGHKILTRINGQTCVDLEDPEGALRGVIGLQIHSGGPMKVRFRNLKLTVPGPGVGEPVAAQ